MAVSYVNLVGTRENPDKTIRALLEDNWDDTNITGAITPTFISDTEEPDFLARDDFSDVNLVTVSFVSTDRIDDSEDEPNGDSIHQFEHIVRIDFWVEDMVLSQEFIDEINRILWEFRPNGATRLNKSDASASEADFFDKTDLTFERIEPEEPENDPRPSWQAELIIMFRKNKTWYFLSLK